MLALLLGGVSVAHAQNRVTPRERPWPAEWPIELPPTDGPLPAEPARIYGAPPATRAAERVLSVIDEVERTMRQTRYQHHRVVRERSGRYYWDCSLMVEWVLQRAAPRSVRSFRDLRRPLAAHFARAIARAPVGRYRDGWTRLERVTDVAPGDVFAWRRPDGFPSRNSGHVGFVMGPARAVPGIPHAYAVRVADATRSLHQNDTRPWPGEGGFGIGTLVFLTDGDGHGTHYGWAGTRSGGYVVTPILFGRVRG